MLEKLRNWSSATNDPARTQALSDAYLPIVREFLLPAIFYYSFVTWAHWRDEDGLTLAILAGISAVTAISFYLLRRHLVRKKVVTLVRLELIGLVANLFIYINVLALMLLHFQETKLIYFVLMAVVFSTSSVTARTTVLSVTLAMATLFYFARGLGSTAYEQFLFIGVASTFASLSMAFLLRSALRHQVNARLQADAVAAEAGQLAETDILTGLPNRRDIFQDLDRRVDNQNPVWLGLLDLDGFKVVNDAYGHVFGDSLLIAVAQRAKSLIGADVTLGRLGGDEFALLADGHLSPVQIEEICGDLIQALSEPFTIGHVTVTVGASVGLCHYPQMASTSESVYEHADYALYRAKAAQRGAIVVFDEDHLRQMADTVAMARALREGNLEEELYLLFQPQFSLKQNRVVGFEALARWNSPRLGEIRPDVFIRAAERSGDITRITRILLQKALAEAKRWPESISLSFNLSTHDLADRTHIQGLLAQISAAGVDPQRVEFEITETAVMLDLETAQRLLGEMSEAGCRIALDDFGSGYSSFCYIDELPLDKIKIDKSFVRKIPRSAASREIVAGLLALCRTLDLDCVLEGVETETDLNLLRSLNPDIIQGFYFGRPMSGVHARQLVDDELFPADQLAV